MREQRARGDSETFRKYRGRELGRENLVASEVDVHASGAEASPCDSVTHPAVTRRLKNRGGADDRDWA